MTTATPTAVAKESSPRAQVAGWVRERVKGGSEFSLPDLRDDAREHFGKDRAFMRALLNDFLGTVFYDVVQGVVGQTRGLVMLGDTVTSEEAFRERAQRRASKWAKWIEHCNGRHISLMEMTREDLIAAAAEREGRAAVELRIAALWRALAERLEGDQAVRERFTPQEIEAVQRTLEGVTEAAAAD